MTSILSLSFLQDLENPKTNTKTAGFTKEERQGFTELLEEGFVDSFRHFYADKPNQYSFGSYMRNARPKNWAGKLVITRYYLQSVLSILKQILGSFINGDNNENAIKQIGLISRRTSAHSHHAFWFIPLPSLHDLALHLVPGHGALVRHSLGTNLVQERNCGRFARKSFRPKSFART